MSNYHKQFAICAALTTLVLPLSAADAISSQTSPQQNHQSSQNEPNRGAGSWQQKAERDWSASNLLRANAMSKDGQTLGQVEDLLINPNTGKADFIVLGEQAVHGTGEDLIPVPWQAVKMRSDGSVVINEAKSKLKSAPSLKKDYSNLDQPDYTVTIYEFYAVPAPSSGSEAADITTQGSGAAQLQEGTTTTNWNGSTRRTSRSKVHH
jgi:sporulation protein YlmC with PRC-barrel domain